AGTQCADQFRKKRSMQIVGHDHAVESSGCKKPGPRLDVRNVSLDAADSLERSERRLVAIDADDGKAQRAQVAHVPAMAAGDVENAPAGRSEERRVGKEGRAGGGRGWGKRR